MVLYNLLTSANVLYLYDFRFKGYGPKCVFYVLVTLTLTLTLTFYLYSTCYHTKYACSTRVSLRSFISICQVVMGDMAADTHTHTHPR